MIYTWVNHIFYWFLVNFVGSYVLALFFIDFHDKLRFS